MTLFVIAFHFAILLRLTSGALLSPVKQIEHAGKQISANVFTCDSSNELLNAVCQVGLRRINNDLEAAGIAIDQDGLLFTWEDPADKKINTGHSCTVTAKVTNQKASARITSGAMLRFNGNSLTEPFAMRLQLPVVLDAKVDVKQRFGTRILGSCSNTGSDSYDLKATLTTTADAMLGLSFNPSFGMLDSGDYGLVIEPKVAVVSQVRNTDLSFRISGVSPLTPVLTFVHGFGSSLFKIVTTLFTGDSIKGVLSGLLFDLGAPIILGIGALPRPLEAEIWDRILKSPQREAEKKAMGFGNDIEEKLQADLRRIFKLQADGKRVFIIKKDIVELVRDLGVNADVFTEPPISPSVECEERAKVPCRSNDLNVIYDVCIPLQQECQRLAREHQEKYSPTSVIVSKPKVASLPPPPTTQPPTTTPPTTRTFTTNCIPRPGQHVEC